MTEREQIAPVEELALFRRSVERLQRSSGKDDVLAKLVILERALAAGVSVTPDAWVPIHPRNGPLWSMTTDKPDPERLPNSYPLRPLRFADGVKDQS